MMRLVSFESIEEYVMAVRFFATQNPTHNPLPKYTVLGLGALLLTACASGGGSGVAKGKGQYEEAIGAYTSPASDPSQFDPVAAAAFWGTRYNRDHQDVEVAVKYSAALRKIGSVDEAVSVITKTAAQNIDNPDVNLEAGKALIEGGRGFEAVRYLEVATSTKRNDWSAFSAYGVALDNIGEHDLARVQYDKALSIAPGALNVMNNKALSFALDGDLSRAERTLRTAATANGANARIRQNLALVLALKGDMAEAERLARSDLPPQLANQNIDYFRSLVNQPAYWAEYAPDNFDAPAFKPATKAPAPQAPKVTPTPLPELREEKKPEEKQDKSAPIALKEVTPITNTSVELPEETPTAASEDVIPVEAVNNGQPVDLAPAAELKPGR